MDTCRLQNRRTERSRWGSRIGQAIHRHTRDEDGGTLTTYTYDVANRLTVAEDANGLTSYTYDANGNQLTIEEPSNDVTTYAWDSENQMIEVEDASNALTTYAYNADKLRVSREDDIETRKYVYDGTNVLLETVDAVTEAVYTLNPQEYGHLLSQHRDETSFYHYDGVQDTRSLSDSTETETDSYTFDPWGRETSSTGTTDNPFTYKGQVGYYKDTALDPSEAAYILHHRILDAIGRFTSPDPAEDDLNRYRYVRNNPLNEVDPSGLRDRSVEQQEQLIQASERRLADLKERLAQSRGKRSSFRASLVRRIRDTKRRIRQQRDELLILAPEPSPVPEDVPIEEPIAPSPQTDRVFPPASPHQSQTPRPIRVYPPSPEPRHNSQPRRRVSPPPEIEDYQNVEFVPPHGDDRQTGRLDIYDNRDGKHKRVFSIWYNVNDPNDEGLALESARQTSLQEDFKELREQIGIGIVITEGVARAVTPGFDIVEVAEAIAEADELTPAQAALIGAGIVVGVRLNKADEFGDAGLAGGGAARRGRRPAAARKPIDSPRTRHGTDEHDATSFNRAKNWEGDAATVESRFNQQLVDADGNAVPGLQPDAQRIRLLPDGRRVVDVLEVRSVNSQSPAFMNRKMQRYRDVLGDQAGDIRWIDPIDTARR